MVFLGGSLIFRHPSELTQLGVVRPQFVSNQETSPGVSPLELQSPWGFFLQPCWCFWWLEPLSLQVSTSPGNVAFVLSWTFCISSFLLWLRLCVLPGASSLPWWRHFCSYQDLVSTLLDSGADSVCNGTVPYKSFRSHLKRCSRETRPGQSGQFSVSASPLGRTMCTDRIMELEDWRFRLSKFCEGDFGDSDMIPIGSLLVYGHCPTLASFSTSARRFPWHTAPPRLYPWSWHGPQNPTRCWLWHS